MVKRGEVMSELMRQENRQESQRERQPVEQDSGMLPHLHVYGKAVFEIERAVVVEIRLHGGSGHSRGEQRQCKEQAIEPVALARARRRERISLRRAVFGVIRV